MEGSKSASTSRVSSSKSGSPSKASRSARMPCTASRSRSRAVSINRRLTVVRGRVGPLVSFRRGCAMGVFSHDQISYGSVAVRAGGSGNFRSARNSCYQKPMSSSSDNKNLGGRPPTGQGVLVGVRLHPDQLAALDKWIGQQPNQMSRPEAIRIFVAAGLHQRPGEGA